MSAVPERKMDVDEYLAWAEGRPGRYELYAGVVYTMSPERVRHGEVKYATQSALAAAIKRAGAPCHMLPDGMTVRIDRHTAHEPDALVYCGPKLPGSAVEVPDPIILVEVLSPSTRHIDASAKLDYFTLPSVRHYLIIDPEKPFVVHHARVNDDLIETKILRDGSLRFEPPGLSVAVADLYPAGDAGASGRSV